MSQAQSIAFVPATTIEATLESTPINNGRIYVTTDTKRLYVDLNSSRLLIDGNIYLETELQRTSIIAPLSNKLYIVKETGFSYMYINGEWKLVGGVSNYEELTNLPKINNVVLSGELNLSDIGAQAAVDDTLTTTDKTISGAINEINERAISSTIKKESHIIPELTEQDESGKYVWTITHQFGHSMIMCKLVNATTNCTVWGEPSSITDTTVVYTFSNQIEANSIKAILMG